MVFLFCNSSVKENFTQAFHSTCKINNAKRSHQHKRIRNQNICKRFSFTKLFVRQNELNKTGKYTVDDDVLGKIREIFWGGCCTEEKTMATIKETLDKYDYLIDTHTAVAVGVYNEYKEVTGDIRPTVIASTASPYKFANSVIEAIGEEVTSDEFETVRKLSKVTSTKIPSPLEALENAEVRFNNVCEKTEMKAVVLKVLGI